MPDVAELMTLLRGDQVGLVFRVDHYGVGSSGAMELDEISHFYVNLHLRDGALRRFVSTGLHQRRRSVETTEWQEGWTTSRVTAPPDCTPREERLPTAATPEAVLEDILGPLRAPAARGWRQVGDDRYERKEEIGRLRLTVGRTLGQRRVETLDDRTGRVLDHMAHFAAGPDLVSPPEASTPCAAPVGRGAVEIRPPDPRTP